MCLRRCIPLSDLLLIFRQQEIPQMYLLYTLIVTTGGHFVHGDDVLGIIVRYIQ